MVAQTESRQINRLPIGVFDSGLGGLTVVRALLSTLPAESITYVGDTARVPYGSKSAETVRRFALQISEYLVMQGVKCIVVACNTATAHALEYLREMLAVPVIGVIAPGARAAVAACRGGTIGVIGTTGTIASGAYVRAIHEMDPAARVLQQACPLFVPLVEEGWLDHPATQLIAQEYLSPLRTARIDTLVMGCTHYPLLTAVIRDILGQSVRLIDSAEETARETAGALQRAMLAVPTDAPPPRHRFIASDAPDRFLVLGRRFLGGTIDSVEHVPFA